jgi:curved DNA-binding protein CbpA
MNLYSSLGLQRDANAQQIRDAYKNLVRTEHPDKGGNAERFKSLQEAYEILSNEKIDFVFTVAFFIYCKSPKQLPSNL